MSPRSETPARGGLEGPWVLLTRSIYHDLERSAGVEGPTCGGPSPIGIAIRLSEEPAGVSASGGNVRKGLRRFRSDRFLADPETNGRVGGDAEHHVRRIVREGPAVPLGKAERRRRADGVRPAAESAQKGTF